MLNKVWGWLNGHKSDLIAGALVAGGVLVLNGIEIPVWIILIVAGAAVFAVRDAIRKIEGE